MVGSPGSPVAATFVSPSRPTVEPDSTYALAKASLGGRGTKLKCRCTAPWLASETTPSTAMRYVIPPTASKVTRLCSCSG